MAHHSLWSLLAATALVACAGAPAPRTPSPLLCASLAGQPVVPADSAVYDTLALDIRPVLISPPILRYPWRAVDAGLQGVAHLEFVVSAAGRVEPASISVDEATNPEFTSTARELVRRSRFCPGSRSGQPVRSRKAMEIRFTLALGPDGVIEAGIGVTK